MNAGGAARKEGVPFSIGRSLLIAQTTVRDALRQRLLVALALLAACFMGAAHWLRELNFGSSELTLIADFGLGTMTFFGGVLMVASGAQLFLGEVEARTAATVLAKAVWRSEFVVGKFFAIAAIAGAFCAAMGAVLAAVLWTREAALMRQFPDAFANGSLVATAPLAAAVLVQWLKLVLLAALLLLLASFARSQLFVITTGVLVWAICELQQVAPAARGASVVMRGFAGLVGMLFPNFQRFDLAAGAGLTVDGAGLLRLALYAGGYAVVVCALATLSFRRREI
ncbi:MAG TPA: ABC transporter permease subunit [Opitutus sp.]|nr:ABC transporter permease subunit [Opitutus sp.]